MTQNANHNRSNEAYRCSDANAVVGTRSKCRGISCDEGEAVEDFKAVENYAIAAERGGLGCEMEDAEKTQDDEQGGGDNGEDAMGQ